MIYKIPLQNGWDLICDKCKERIRDIFTYQEILDILKFNGWFILRENSNIIHMCPKCKK